MGGDQGVGKGGGWMQQVVCDCISRGAGLSFLDFAHV